MKLSVIIPVYNEEKTVSKIIAKVLKQKMVFEVIVVDDASTDKSAFVVGKIKSPKVRLIRHKTNKGKGGAIISGIKKARGEFIIIQDADLELNPDDFASLTKPFKNNDADFVIGNRWEKQKLRSITRVGNLYISALVYVLFNTYLKDPYCCYKVAPRHLWRRLSLTSMQFEVEAEIIAKICKSKYKIAEVPVGYYPRTYKEGKKITAIDALKGTLAFLKFRLG